MLERRTVRIRIQHSAMAGEKDLSKIWLVKKLASPPLLSTPEDGMFPGEKYFTKAGSEGFYGSMEHYPVILPDDTLKKAGLWNVMRRSKNILCAGAVSIEERERCLADGIAPGSRAVCSIWIWRA